MSRNLYRSMIRVAHANPGPVRDALMPMIRSAKAKNVIDAYSDDYELRDLNYRDRRWLSPRQWEKVMTEATPFGYNAFDAMHVGRWFKDIQKRFGKIQIQPGREYSVVAYVKGPPEALAALQTEARDEAHADEYDMESDGTLRLWWD